MATVLGGALPVEVTDDIRGAQWTKLLINHVNALPAITGLSVQEVVADDGLRRGDDGEHARVGAGRPGERRAVRIDAGGARAGCSS